MRPGSCSARRFSSRSIRSFSSANFSHRSGKRWLIAALAATSLSAPFANAASLQAYAYSAGGQSTSPTEGPTDHMRYDYPGGQSGKYYVLTPGPGFNVAEDTEYHSAATGPLTASTTMNAPLYTGSYTGSAQAYASYGRLGVSATGTYAGVETNPNGVAGSEAFATFTETFTIAGTPGQSGYFVPTFTVDGSWNKTGRGAVQFEMDERAGNGATILQYKVQGDSEWGSELYYHGFVNAIPGMTTAPGSASGSAQITLDPVAFQFNQAFDVTFALYASVMPYNNGSSSVEFLHTALLSGISVLDASRQALDGFAITSGSGTLYTANGVQAVPVPGAAWLFASSMAGLAAIRRRRE